VKNYALPFGFCNGELTWTNLDQCERINFHTDKKYRFIESLARPVDHPTAEQFDWRWPNLLPTVTSRLCKLRPIYSTVCRRCLSKLATNEVNRWQNNNVVYCGDSRCVLRRFIFLSCKLRTYSDRYKWSPNRNGHLASEPKDWYCESFRDLTVCQTVASDGGAYPIEHI